MTGFDPARHRMVPEQRWFEDFRLGERFVLPSRTMTEAIFLAITFAVLIANLIVDLVIVFFDPRVRAREAAR